MFDSGSCTEESPGFDDSGFDEDRPTSEIILLEKKLVPGKFVTVPFGALVSTMFKDNERCNNSFVDDIREAEEFVLALIDF